MRIINKTKLEIAIKALKQGGVIAFPTETSYGLACDMTNKDAVLKVYAIKNRPADKPLSALVSSIEMAEEYVELSEQARKLAKEYWPGALTIIFRATNHESRITKKLFLLPNQNTIAMRVSSHPVAQELVKNLGKPISATSANIAGETNIYDPKELIQQFENNKNKPDLVIDAGVLEQIPPSTIVKVVGEEVEVLRQGSLKIQETRIQKNHKSQSTNSK